MAAKKFSSLKDEEIVRTLKCKTVMSGAAAYTEVAFDTQLSIERGVIWLINQMSFYFASGADHLAEVGAADQEYLMAHVAREPKTAILTLDDPDLIQLHEISVGRSAAIGTDAGPLWIPNIQPIVYAYNPPLPYAANSIYLGAYATAAAAVTVYAKIHYTIRSVSDKYFFRVAQALLG